LPLRISCTAVSGDALNLCCTPRWPCSIVAVMRANGVGKPGRMPLYEEIAARIGALIDRGTYLPGDRIPSIRELSRQLRVSVSTVMEAYAHLEDARCAGSRCIRGVAPN